MTLYRLTFSRIGRGSRGEVAEFIAKDADDLAEQVFRFSRGKLGSKWYEVTVDLDGMVGSIEYGRFGSFTIDRPVPA